MRNFALRKGRDTYRYVSPIIAKGDGSLSNGVEFNYQPMTVDAFKPLANIVEEERGGCMDTEVTLVFIYTYLSLRLLMLNYTYG